MTDLNISESWLSCIDNHEYFFENAPNDVFCKKCGCVIDDSYIPNSFRIKNRADFSSTYDGRLIASAKFKEYVDGLNFQVEFTHLNQNKTLFLMKPKHIIEYDAAQKENYCEVCGQYHDQVAPIPIFYYKDKKTIKTGIYRTSMKFGSGVEKNFSIVLGAETGILLQEDAKRLKFRGLVIHPI